MPDKTERAPKDIRLGATVRALRQSRGLSTAELAGLISKSEPMVNAIERGTRHASREICGALAEVLRVPVTAIVEPPEQDSDTESAA